MEEDRFALWLQNTTKWMRLSCCTKLELTRTYRERDAPHSIGTYSVLRDEGNNPLLVRALIQAGADVKIPDSTLNTPLHFTESEACALMLIDAGADINAVNMYGRVAIETRDSIRKTRRRKIAETFQGARYRPLSSTTSTYVVITHSSDDAVYLHLQLHRHHPPVPPAAVQRPILTPPHAPRVLTFVQRRLCRHWKFPNVHRCDTVVTATRE